MRGWAMAAGMATVLFAGTVAASERESVISDRRALAKACHRAERPARRHRLYMVEVPSFRLGRYDAVEGLLPVDTRRNLRVLEGTAELFPADLSPIGFEVSAERAARLRRAVAKGGVRLRVGFFLGFDDRGGTVCLMRSRFGVTTVRIDPAFVELVGKGGKRLARQTTDRLRAWLDDLERDRVPGQGPRGALRPASFSSRSGEPPEAWQRALAAANGTSVARAVARCHARAVEEGAPGRGRVVVRLRVDAAGGGVRGAAVELSTAPRPESECIAEALSGLELPPAPQLGSGAVDLSVPVQLAD
ncbi:MAG: hypothetical protein ACODAU_02300 [Myxococcota bacterium]